MIRVYLADGLVEERSALRLLLLDLQLDVVGESDDWVTTLAEAPDLSVDMLVLDWAVLPENASVAIDALRKACPAALVIVLISHLDARAQAAASAGADAFISKGETLERVIKRLQSVAAGIGNGRRFQTPTPG